ncbi:MAG: hypothetical protein DRI95_01265 [Bacteroidetes bacterium]|nr:MAG: hypothetical protein DRI95_01265 [Bacteroidota bacterium]
MSSFRIRPQFKVIINKSKEDIENKIKDHIQKKSTKFIAQQIPGFIILKIPEPERHFWSPELSLTFEKKENGTLIKGLYGPKPSIWSFFSFSYIGLAVFTFFAFIFGSVQLSLDQEAPIFWSLSIFVSIALGIYLIAQFGQKVGVEQTFRLHHFFEETVGKKVHIN